MGPIFQPARGKRSVGAVPPAAPSPTARWGQRPFAPTVVRRDGSGWAEEIFRAGETIELNAPQCAAAVDELYANVRAQLILETFSHTVWLGVRRSTNKRAVRHVKSCEPALQ